MWSIFKKTIKEKRVLTFSLFVISLLMILMYTSLFPAISKQTAALKTILDQYPKELWQTMGISGGALDLTSYTQYITLELFSLMWPILVIILIANLASNALAGEIDKGTLQILLSQPVSRVHIFLAKYFAGLTLITIFVAISTLSVIGFAKLFSIDVVYLTYFKLFAIGLAFAAACYSASMLLAVIFNKGFATALTVGGFLVMYVLNVVSQLTPDLTKLKYFSAFHYLAVGDLLSQNHLPLIHIGVFAVVMFVSTILALWYFNSRDINF